MPQAIRSLSRRRLFGAIPALAVVSAVPSGVGTFAAAWRNVDGEIWWGGWAFPEQLQAIGEYAATLGLHPDDAVMVGLEGKGADKTLRAFWGDPWGGYYVVISAVGATFRKGCA